MHRTNRLAHETSPYLRQHAHNPVDWFPWGPEALARARELDRPIFLSIGYSACHWCHVMERESFEDPAVGTILNEHFVSIKVDREERPDLDQIYMTSVQLMTRQGGWPMSMFLTPDLKPFYGGTYFPPDDRYGRPGFKQLLLALADAWDNRRQEVLNVANNAAEQVRFVMRLQPGEGGLSADLGRNAVRVLAGAFDARHGGFGSAPKFPHPMDLRLLLRAWRRYGDDQALHMVHFSLTKMAQGGIYDHLGGGFARYSTDERWLVPHFEKMLYDNALLTAAYLEAYQASGDAYFREVAAETLDFVQRDLTSPEGAFWSTLDADSEGVEGKFYVWSRSQVEQILGTELGQVFCSAYDVTERGNWEGHNILHRTGTWEQHAAAFQRTVPELRQQVDEARRNLLAVRNRRVWPERDEKVLTSWNGLMIASFAQAAQALDEPRYAETAARAADFLLARMRTGDGKLLRTWFAGSAAKLNGYLEDYAFLIDGLISLYEAMFAPRWVEAALDLAAVLVAQFWDEGEGGFFYTGRDHEQLLTRSKDTQDNATPSGNAMAATALFRLAALTGREDLRAKAVATLEACQGILAEHPMAAGQMLMALDWHLGPVQEFAIVGEPNAPATRAVLRYIHSAFSPNKVVACKAPHDAAAERVIPLLAGKEALGDVTTYLCQNFTCQLPLVGVDAVEKALNQ